MLSSFMPPFKKVGIIALLLFFSSSVGLHQQPVLIIFEGGAHKCIDIKFCIGPTDIL